MVAGFWMNNDGLPIQYGSQKAVFEPGGDYMVYGEVREIEQLIPLVAMNLGTGASSTQIPAPPTSFSGTSTPIAAGIQSLTTLVPLQATTPVTTTTSGALVISAPQLFFEQIEVDTIIPAAGSATSISVGLVTNNPTVTPATFVQVTPNNGTQILNTFVNASMATTGQKNYWNLPGSSESYPATTAGGGDWLGLVPKVTNSITPLPNAAWISVIQNGGTYTNGLIKLRIKYWTYGNINF